MFEWLAGFMMNPTLAVGGAAVASPILIHIFSKRRFRRVRWAAMDFLLEAQRRNRRRVRLEQYILLALRCLAVLLIALMITRPFLNPSALGSWLGARARTERIVLLDDSFSMGYRSTADDGPPSTCFRRGLKAIEHLTTALAEQNSKDPLTVYLTSEPTAPTIALPGITADRRVELHDYLATLTPSESAGNLREAIAALAGELAQRPTQANTAIYLVSDFQRHDWAGDLSDAAQSAAASPLAPLRDLDEADASPLVVFLDVAARRPRNLAVTAIESQQPQVVAGVPARFELSVTNHAGLPAANVEMSVSVGGQTLPPLSIASLAAGQTIREPVEIAFPRPGFAVVSVALAGEAASASGLPLDDRRGLAVDVAPAIRILVVNGEPSIDGYQDEVYLLRTALRPEGRAASGNEVTVVTENELDGMALAEYHTVVLANVYHLGEGARRNLEQYVERGGGVILFAGDQIDIEEYNATLYRAGRGMLPAPLREIVQTPPAAQPPGVGDWDASHPVMRAFVEQLAAVLREVRVETYIAVDVEADDPPVEQDGPTTRPAGQPIIVARLDDAARTPLVVEKRFGAGRCIWIGTSADLEWNDWAASFSYLPMLLQFTQYTARPSGTPGDVAVGRPIVLPAKSVELGAEALVRPPDYPDRPEATIRPRGVAGDEAVFVFENTARSGVYAFHAVPSARDKPRALAVVNPDPAESDLTRAGEATLRRAAEGLSHAYVRDVAVLAEAGADGRQEFWWPLLLAAIVVLMMEQGLAWWFGTRG